MLLKCAKNHKLTTTERIVIDYINANDAKVLDMSILDIAKEAGVSTSTISRAIRKCGINKLSDIRFKIVEGDYISNNFLQDLYKECSKAVREIDINAIMSAVEYIKSANRIHIFGKSYNELLAEEFAFRLQLLGYSAQYCLYDMTRYIGKTSSPGDIVFLFSIQGENEEMLVAATMARRYNIPVIVCCGNKNSTLVEMADIAIVFQKDLLVLDKQNNIKLNSRLGFWLISQSIIDCLSKDNE